MCDVCSCLSDMSKDNSWKLALCVTIALIIVAPVVAVSSSCKVLGANVALGT